MPTINQLIKQGREDKVAKSGAPIMDKCPQKRGVCLSVTTTSPKKPNSALRKIARVRLVNGMEGFPTVMKLLLIFRVSDTICKSTAWF